jgi:hypothetical protein
MRACCGTPLLSGSPLRRQPLTAAELATLGKLEKLWNLENLQTRKQHFQSENIQDAFMYQKRKINNRFVCMCRTYIRRVLFRRAPQQHHQDSVRAMAADTWRAIVNHADVLFWGSRGVLPCRTRFFYSPPQNNTYAWLTIARL